MVSRSGGGSAEARLRLVTAEELAVEAAERDRQQLAVACRLAAQAELGVCRITVCGLRDTYVVEAPAQPAVPAAEASDHGQRVMKTLWRRIANKGAATR